ncbi:hypothetical protein QC761_302040 [Podospora bellae-mahoneyi]|uniref:Uncharacterized protein n=1 Tax=Podospora bellae-mahoneyi TaxID=2093777 RepID=A0ABR0FLJ7_9PEZI|nr:hypothetical protein QC761_302040 [Podospora bellae-mahoneyi]
MGRFCTKGQTKAVPRRNYGSREQGLWSAWYELGDKEPQSNEALSRYKAGLYRTHWRSSTARHGHMESSGICKGNAFPSLYAHVFIQAQTADPALAGRPEFSIFGILMEPIRGFILENLPDLPASDAPPKELWKTIVQDAVYPANEINKRGVVVLDCRAGNALAEHDTHRVVIHDFAQCQFRDEVEARYAEQKAEARRATKGKTTGGKLMSGNRAMVCPPTTKNTSASMGINLPSECLSQASC